MSSFVKFKSCVVFVRWFNPHYKSICAPSATLREFISIDKQIWEMFISFDLHLPSLQWVKGWTVARPDRLTDYAQLI